MCGLATLQSMSLGRFLSGSSSSKFSCRARNTISAEVTAGQQERRMQADETIHPLARPPPNCPNVCASRVAVPLSSQSHPCSNSPARVSTRVRAHLHALAQARRQRHDNYHDYAMENTLSKTLVDCPAVGPTIVVERRIANFACAVRLQAP